MAANNIRSIQGEDAGDPGTSGAKLGRWSGSPWMWRGASLASTVLFPVIVMLLTPVIANLAGVKGFGGLMSVAAFKEEPFIFAVLLGQVVVMSLWYWSQIRVMQNMHTTVNELKTEANISIWMGYAAVAFGAWSLGAHNSVYLTFLVPGIFQILDGPGSTGTGINNAAQKPIMQRA